MLCLSLRFGAAKGAVSNLPSKSSGVRNLTLAVSFAQTVQVLAFASGCSKNKGLLTSQALPLSEACAGSKLSLLRVKTAAVSRPLLCCQTGIVQLTAELDLWP